MVKIRLMRVGKKKQPSYRVVVADSRSPRDGRIIESIGHYQPRLEPSEIVIDADRAVHWLKVGAQPTEQVRKLLEISGAWSAFTGKPVEVKPKATPAASTKKATPAASVAEDTEVAVTPEAEDETAAAPEAEAVEAGDVVQEAAPEASAEADGEESKA